MRSSTIMTVLCAGLAIASPIVKKALVTDIITTIVYVTVTEGQIPTSTSTSTTKHHKVHTKTTTKVVSATPAPPPPAPSTSTTSSTSTTPPPPPAPTTTETPAPIATTTEAPAVEAAPATTAAAETTAAPVVTQTDDSFEGTVLYHHNVHRANHSAPDVSYDSTIAGYAAQVASSCHYAHDLTPGGGGYGQNIAVYGTTSDPKAIGAAKSAAQAISDMWYNGEVNLFPSNGYGQASPDMSNFEAWGHYSQVVWKGTTGVGCASQYCDAGTIFSGMGSWFTVCNYSPAGNMGGAYGSNVNPPEGKATVSS